MTDLKRPVPCKFLGDGSVEAVSCLTPTALKVRAQVAVPPDRVIPVLLVPGIMGTNLRKISDPSVKLWAPPNDLFGEVSAGSSGYAKNAARRQRLFEPTDAEVDDSGLIVLPETIPWLDAATARSERGWGTVHWKSYGALLLYLETHLNHVYVNQQLQPEWSQMHAEQDTVRWDARLRKKYTPVTADELKRLPRAFYPVYAAGYNWLRSNNDSAVALKARIEEIVGHWKQGRACDQVILVTHSMGGLVARRCAQLLPEKILGVIHGVLPALGAAAIYKRMRAGFDGVASAYLGLNEAETTACLANAPGPLELLPQARYNGGKPWLAVQAQEAWGATYAETKFPQKDPYEEIYKKDAKACLYGLVNSELIDPAKIYSDPKAPWRAYLINLNKAQKFHDQLNNFYHPRTYAFYGADQRQRAWGEISWQTTELRGFEASRILEGVQPQSDGLGQVVMHLDKRKLRFKLSAQEALGDGTVPAEASGNDPAEQDVLQCFRLSGFEHQFAYNDPEVRLIMLYSLAKLIQNSPLVSKA